MGLIQKKEESKDEIEGIEIIGRGEGPDGVPVNPIELVAGESAEDIADGTTAEERAAADDAAVIASAADDALMPEEDFDGEEELEDDSDDTEAPDGKKGKAVALVCVVAAVVIAAIVGYFIGHGAFGAKGADSATLTEDQLSATVASYTYNGARHDVSAQEVLEYQYSLESQKNDDGTYTTPSAENILSYVRNQILVKAAEDKGFTASDDDVLAYAEDTIGTSDYAEMASSYNVTEDQAKEIVRRSYLMQQLYNDVVGEVSLAQPTQPEDDGSGEATKEYADYIIDLAGDAWDSEKNTWADSESAWAQAFSDSDFSADAATYDQALTAYYQARSDYQNSVTELQSTWTTYANGLYENANLQIFGLYA